MDETRLDEFISKMSAEVDSYVRELHEKQLIADILLIYNVGGDYESYENSVREINTKIREYNRKAMMFTPGETKLGFTYKVERPILSKRIFDFICSLAKIKEISPSKPLPYSLHESRIIDTTPTAEAMEEYRKFLGGLYHDSFKWHGIGPEPVIVREPLCEDETERGEE